MKIGVVDSGVCREFLRRYPLTLSAAASFALDRAAGQLEGRFYDREELLAWQRGELAAAIEDEHGHGTAVLSILQDRARPGAEDELFVARILDRDATGHSACLVAALEWLVDEIVPDVVNLSLGTTRRAAAPRLRRIVARAVERRTLIVCAAGNAPSLPAQIAGTLAVADAALAQRAPAALKIDYVVTEPTARTYSNGSWGTRPMTTSYACAVAVSAFMRGERWMPR